jgi:hypothetical protein
MRIRRLDVAYAGLSMAVVMVAAFVVLELWRADLRVPLAYSGDANLLHTFVKGILENGWYLENPSLGAPGEVDLYDYPVLMGNNLDVLLIRVLGLGSDDAALVMNVFFLLTFPLIALTAYITFRVLGISSGAAVVCSALYALLPYHFLHGEVHLIQAAYYAVPPAAYLILSVLGGRPLFARRDPPPRRRLFAYASRRSLATVAICLLIASASSGFYYTGFTLLLVTSAAVLAFLGTGSRRALATGGALVAVLAAISIVNLAPTILYRVEHGTNPELSRRGRLESEMHSFKLAQLVLPLQHHRISPLGDLRERYERRYPAAEGSFSTLGAVTAAGFLSLLAVALVSMVRRGPPLQGTLYHHAAVATVIAFLFGTMGGFSTLLGAALPLLRAWSRISVFIAFFSLLAVGLALDALRRRFAERGRPATLGAAVLAAVLVAGVADQTTNAFTPPHAALQEEWDGQQTFVSAIEARLPDEGSLYQLPYVPFPEWPAANRMQEYDLARGYLHSTDLRWSFAAIKGREADRWLRDVSEKPLAEALPILSAVGFEGVYLDRFGYADNAEAVENELRRILGVEPLASSDGRLLFFGLGDYSERLRQERTREELEALRAGAPGQA